MKISYQWIKELIPSFKKTPQELGEVLSTKIAETENIFDLSQGLEKVVVAEILEIKPHPRADKLKIVLVETGQGKRKIVCGAPNLIKGQKVPLALEGACLFNGLKIDKAVIRGVESKGMLCAEDELGLGVGHEGIMILSSDLKPGTKLIKALNRDDVILEIENKALTHRPDLFNHFGLAREIGAVLNLKTKIKDFSFPLVSKKDLIKIKIEEKNLCPRYLGVVMEGIKIKPSPLWLKNRLRNLGVKPINNLVDITNYVLWEIGQPLHAFDAEKIKGEEINVRLAQKGEKLLALDDQLYQLNSNNLVVADQEKPIALAGIIGGKESAITKETKKIIIESANFNPTQVRRSGWELGLRTEAVIRFEKGLPLSFASQGLVRAIELVKELAQGKVVSKIYDQQSPEAKKALNQKREIIFNPEKAQQFIGVDISPLKMKQILKNLGSKIKPQKKDLIIIPPDHRTDLTIFEDLVEEIVRIYGSEKINSQPILSAMCPLKQTPEYILENKLKNLLTSIGFDEVYSYAFSSEKKIKYFKENLKPREITNPLSSEEKYLRLSLVPDLIDKALKNSRYFSEFMIFEIGRVFCPQEKKKIGGLIFKESVKEKKNSSDIYANICERKCFLIKNTIDLIFQQINIDQDKIVYPLKISLKEEIKYQEKVIGFWGENQTQAYFELDFESLLKLPKQEKKYKKIINYPPVKRDLAFLINDNVCWRDIYQSLKKLDNYIVDLIPFDLFQDQELGGKYNLGFHVIYQSDQGTLKSAVIEKIEEKIIKLMKEKFKAQLRDF